MFESRVGEIYRILQYENGHVVFDRVQGLTDEVIPVDLCQPWIYLGDMGCRLMIIRDIMLAWNILIEYPFKEYIIHFIFWHPQ